LHDYAEDFVVNKSNLNRIFVAGQGATSPYPMLLHKTVDGGANWNTYTIATVQGYGYCVDIDPSNDNLIYVGGYYYPSGSYMGCIFKSTDGGLSWTKAWESGGYPVYAIVVDPISPNRIYAGTSGAF
jgi:photosystem II stability/assembly factor-like uncharacterized protein